LAATASHSSCVSDYGKLGYVKLPDAALGVYADFNGPLITKEVREPAKSADIKVGDEVISVDGKPIASMLDSFKALNTKSVRDKVKVVVKRDNHELTFEPVSVARGEQ
jgi:S1-C subfamily serine protease